MIWTQHGAKLLGYVSVVERTWLSAGVDMEAS